LTWLRQEAFQGKVYNFSVAELESYAVGNNNVLVHNVKCFDDVWEPGEELPSGFQDVSPSEEELCGEFPTEPGGTGDAYDEANGQGVYVLRDPNVADPIDSIEYVGSGDAPARLVDHALLGSGKDDLVGDILFDNNLPAGQAKSLEQELMQMLGGPQSVNPSTPLRNLIQSIGESNSQYASKEFAASDSLVFEALRRAGALGAE
jgi:hypothetical protein